MNRIATVGLIVATCAALAACSSPSSQPISPRDARQIQDQAQDARQLIGNIAVAAYRYHEKTHRLAQNDAEAFSAVSAPTSASPNTTSDQYVSSVTVGVLGTASTVKAVFSNAANPLLRGKYILRTTYYGGAPSTLSGTCTTNVPAAAAAYFAPHCHSTVGK